MGTTGQKGQYVIGVLIGDVSYEFTAELLDGLSDGAASKDIHIVYFLGMQKHSDLTEHSVPELNDNSSNSVYDYTALSGADAFIVVCGSLSGYEGKGGFQEFLRRFESVPYVVLQERVSIAKPNQTYIVVDNYSSYSRCVEHLIVEHGYRKIAFVSGPEGHADAKERLAAYLDIMARYQLPVTPQMIAFGDFYEFVDRLVAQLIDQNPGLEAIAFANDEMAKAGYRECRRRGWTVGRDLAIVGFDNFTTSRTMEPPLTTVSQDTYAMGKTALEYAVALIRGQSRAPLEMRTEFISRQSCGCARSNYRLTLGDENCDDALLINDAIEKMICDYVSNFTLDERPHHEQAIRQCFLKLRDIALNEPEQPIDLPALSNELNALFHNYSHPALLLAQSVEGFMLQLLGTHGLPPSVKKFATCVSYMQQFIHTREVVELTERFDAYRRQSWIAPELTRGLYNQNSEEAVFRCVAERLLGAGLRDVHICLLDIPTRYGKTGLLEKPKRLRLVVNTVDGEVKAFRTDDAPIIDEAHPLRDLASLTSRHSTMSFSIYSGENQYGILLCEVNRKQYDQLHVIGLQLGMLMDFLDLRQKERNIAMELEDIREKNEILNFLSEYDQLCGLLNRRGFIERAIRRNRENIGKSACCAFLDLDYLKQINDTYGHPEGDVALQAVSGILRKITAADDLIGRIGGDEFVGLFITDDTHFAEHFYTKLYEACSVYDSSSGKPYRLDVSVGIANFICRQGLEISSIIAEADKYLYEAKRKRAYASLRSNSPHVVMENVRDG